MVDGLTRQGLAIIIQAGSYDRVHFSLVMASAAAAIGRPTLLFFTGRSLRALLADEGWRALDFADEGTSAGSRDALLAHRNVATLPELLEACRDLGTRFLACEMGWRALGFDKPNVRPDLPVETAGVVTLLTSIGPEWRLLFV